MVRDLMSRDVYRCVHNTSYHVQTLLQMFIQTQELNLSSPRLRYHAHTTMLITHDRLCPGSAFHAGVFYSIYVVFRSHHFVPSSSAPSSPFPPLPPSWTFPLRYFVNPRYSNPLVISSLLDPTLPVPHMLLDDPRRRLRAMLPPNRLHEIAFRIYGSPVSPQPLSRTPPPLFLPHPLPPPLLPYTTKEQETHPSNRNKYYDPPDNPPPPSPPRAY